MPQSEAPTKARYYYKEHLKDLLVELGFSEIFGYTFLSENDLKTIGIPATDLLEVSNPVQIENKYMKSSLLPNLMRAIAKNPTFDPIQIFEIGQVFSKSREDSHFAIATSGKNAKKLIESAQKAICNNLNIDASALLIRELSRDDLIRYKIKKPVTFVIEVDVNEILKDANLPENQLEIVLPNKIVHYRTVSKYPAITRDLAFIVDNDTDPDQVANEIYDSSDLIGRVELFDEFSSDKFGANKKNIAYHIYLQHLDRTLVDAEAEEVVKQITEIVATKFKGELRDK
jgi:phenylalanyl-tRNA synthetase beta chain